MKLPDAIFGQLPTCMAARLPLLLSAHGGRSQPDQNCLFGAHLTMLLILGNMLNESSMTGNGYQNLIIIIWGQQKLKLYLAMAGHKLIIVG